MKVRLIVLTHVVAKIVISFCLILVIVYLCKYSHRNNNMDKLCPKMTT
jgi:hypothetical protein